MYEAKNGKRAEEETGDTSKKTYPPRKVKYIKQHASSRWQLTQERKHLLL
jgi:hypothetical protein